MITINTQQIAEEIADALLEGHKHCEGYAPDDAALIKEYLDGYFKEGMMAVRMDAIDEFANWLVKYKVIPNGAMKELIRDFNGEQLKEQTNE